jgi:hypothetical protein
MPSSPAVGPVTPASVEARTSQLAERLAAALTARGLRARTSRGAWVLASNPAGDPPDGYLRTVPGKGTYVRPPTDWP